MNKIIIIGLALVCLIITSRVDAFCGGCGCNIFGCNCDFRPWECKKGRIITTVSPNIFEDADLNKDDTISLEELRAYFQDKDLIGLIFNKLDLNGDGKLNSTEIDSKI